jgi:hypothetical protein
VVCGSLDESESEPIYSFHTAEYKVHYLETPNGLRLVLTTDPSLPRLQESLLYIYKLYVEHVVKNPLYAPGDVIEAPNFCTKLDTWLENLPFFA